jgi:chemotaxis signal transduction protein
MKNSSDTIGNRTRDVPACRAVPQPTAPPRALGVPDLRGTLYNCHWALGVSDLHGTLYNCHWALGVSDLRGTVYNCHWALGVSDLRGFCTIVTGL